jgi:hypothetical protein
MTVYVDDANIPYGRMKMSHMFADTLEELLEMVDKIGVQRKWLQQPPKASWVHFDIALSKKTLAIRAGAVLTDKYGPIRHLAKHGSVSHQRLVAVLDAQGVEAK